MSGLLALLDDVAGIAKLAAASIDDIGAQAVKSGAKAAGAVIDDAAVTPKYVQGLPAARELPIVGKIALGSIRNKLIILLPIALLLSAFAPWAIMPLLMLGGGYLCFEGAEKVHHALFPPKGHATATGPKLSVEHLEEQKVSGAIKTDFILSAEIMTIALSAIPEEAIWMEAVILAIVGIGITTVVYGSVALIVKADDLGLHLAREGRSGAVRGLGRGIVRWMPAFMRVLTVVGTAAMIWVGGSIVVHGLESFGLTAPGHWIEHMAEVASDGLGGFAGAAHWVVTAFFDGILGLAVGFALIPVAGLVARLRGGDKAAAAH
ncbi:DUF808 domain-containing protein [Frigidibacter sp. MR17.14]|uniref:DUF808 domain-containing protein n=1 Tax=Frigidibacter sp. MR17.14 TaxID=3126509 RepID=UPI00301301B5